MLSPLPIEFDAGQDQSSCVSVEAAKLIVIEIDLKFNIFTDSQSTQMFEIVLLVYWTDNRQTRTGWQGSNQDVHAFMGCQPAHEKKPAPMIAGSFPVIRTQRISSSVNDVRR